jgi:hypothetical protein
MDLELVELRAKTEIKSAESRGRAGEFPGREIDLRYLVLKKDGEVAFLWYEMFPTGVGRSGNLYLC